MKTSSKDCLLIYWKLNPKFLIWINFQYTKKVENENFSTFFSIKGDKITKHALKELEKDEWIISSKKTGEIHYSLNPEKTGDILKFYEEYCQKI